MDSLFPEAQAQRFVFPITYDLLIFRVLFPVISRVLFFQDFQEGTEPTIFLLTSQVGGLGLTLTNADRVIVVDPAWNPRYIHVNSDD